MDGEVILRGTRLNENQFLNFQQLAIVTDHDDAYTVPLVFDYLDGYFVGDDIADEISLFTMNGDNCKKSTFTVFRIRPWIDADTVLKFQKKQLLGLLTEQLLKTVEKQDIDNVLSSLNGKILSPIEDFLRTHGFSVYCENLNFSLVSKIIDLKKDEINDTTTGYTQYQLKSLLIDIVSKLKTDNYKLLLWELPEYAVSSSEFSLLMKQLRDMSSDIDNIIVYTKNLDICNYFGNIYSYHLCKNGKIRGMDDYDEFEQILLDEGVGADLEIIRSQFIRALFDKWQFETTYTVVCKELFSDN